MNTEVLKKNTSIGLSRVKWGAKGMERFLKQDLTFRKVLNQGNKVKKKKRSKKDPIKPKEVKDLKKMFEDLAERNVLTQLELTSTPSNPISGKLDQKYQNKLGKDHSTPLGL